MADLTVLDGRRSYALAHPYTDPRVDDVAAYRLTEEQPDGNLLMSVLAVDR
jgi:hypothetical protein